MSRAAFSGDGLDLADWDDLNRSDSRDPCHDLDESEGDVVGLLPPTVGRDRHQHPRGKSRAAELAGPLEEQVVWVEVLDEDGVAPGNACVAHQAPRKGRRPARAGQPQSGSYQSQQRDAQFPGGPDVLAPVVEVTPPADGYDGSRHPVRIIA